MDACPVSCRGGGVSSSGIDGRQPYSLARPPFLSSPFAAAASAVRDEHQYLSASILDPLHTQISLVASSAGGRRITKGRGDGGSETVDARPALKRQSRTHVQYIHYIVM